MPFSKGLAQHPKRSQAEPQRTGCFDLSLVDGSEIIRAPRAQDDVAPLILEGSKYPNTWYLPQTILTIPNIEAIDTLYLCTLDP